MKRIRTALVLIILLTMSFDVCLADSIGNQSFSDGSSYQGMLNDQNERIGFGLYTYADGGMYYGLWQGGSRNGYGVFLRSPAKGGGMRAGFWKDGKLEGQAMTLSSDGTRFEGIFSNDLANGDGYIIETNGTMTSGTWRDGKCVSVTTKYENCLVPKFDIVSFANGACYLGEMVQGSLLGYGVYVFPSGNYYVGQFYNNAFSGYGVHVDWQTNGYIAGNFINGQADGLVFSYFLNGPKSVMGYSNGEVINDQSIGQGHGSTLHSKCNGTGKIICNLCGGSGSSYAHTLTVSCTNCLGKGWNPCISCGGTGFVN